MSNSIPDNELTENQKKNLSSLNEVGKDVLRKLEEINSLLARSGSDIVVGEIFFTEVKAEGHPLDEITPCCCTNGKYVLYCNQCNKST